MHCLTLVHRKYIYIVSGDPFEIKKDKQKPPRISAKVELKSHVNFLLIINIRKIQMMI
jgi:hypothetical protein